MTVPRGVMKVADMVREMVPIWRNRFSKEEIDLAPHIRGNEKLFKALVALVDARIGGRAKLPVPSDPLSCRAILERDAELRWLTQRLDSLYRSPVSERAGSGEPLA